MINIKKLSAFLPILLIGCMGQNDFSMDNDYSSDADIIANYNLTRSACNNDIDSIYFVSEEDVNSYIQFKKLSRRKEELTVENIAPITNESGNICAYVINYTEGWEIISADKRYAPVIGQSDVGCFKYEDAIEPIAVWLNSVFEDIEFLRHSDNLHNVFVESSFEQMSSYQEFWNIITANQDYLEANSIKTKALPGTGGGMWELTNVIIDTVGYQRVDHLITTHWHQNSPYNSFCPFTSYSSIYHAPAGCVAIAGAQTAYYLHGKLGRPVESPLNVFCSAQVPSPTEYYSVQLNDPQMYAYNFSSTAWNEMEIDDDVLAALIAYVGICSSMNYGDSGSGALGFGSLSFWYFINNRIGCASNYLNNNTYPSLYANILNGLPVIAGATSNVIGASGSHAFIIDGYKNCRERITTEYTWVPDNPQTPQFYDDRIVISYSLPFNHQITMNWGWGNDYPYDAGWYSPAGDWHVADYNYNYDKEMVYDFHNLQ